MSGAHLSGIVVFENPFSVLRLRKAGAPFLGLLVAGCQPPAASPPPVVAPPTMELPSPAPASSVTAVPPVPPAPASLAELVHKTGEDYARAWKARDATKLGALYAEGACIKAPGRPDTCGRSKIAEASEALWAMFPDARTAWGRSWLKGDVLVVESAWTGTNDGDVSGRKPTHKIVGAPTLTVSWFLPDGKIREQHVYCDEGSIAMQLGTGASGRAFGGLPTTRERHDAREAAIEEANVLSVKDGLGAKASAFADDAELVDFSHPGSLPEKKGALRWIGLRSGPLPSSRVVLSHVVGVGDVVISEYEAEGKSGGKPVTVHGVEVLDLEDSKVRRAVRYRDSLESAPLPFLPLPVPSVAL